MNCSGCSRRDFLKESVGATLASVLPLSAFTFLTSEEARAAVTNTKVRWAFLVDTRKCVGCGLCVKACKNENEVPWGVNRQKSPPWLRSASRLSSPNRSSMYPLS